MSLEPDDIRYHEFRRSVRGYSPDEVDDLLDSLADDLEEARSERDRLSGEMEDARKRIEQYESLENSIRDTLDQAEKAAADYQQTARRDAESTVEAARREADSIVRDAERRAERMLADSSGKVERVQDSYEALRETRRMFDTELRRLLESYMSLLDEANSSTAREIEAPLQERLDPEAIAAARDAAEQERAEAEQPADSEARIEEADAPGESSTVDPGDEENSGSSAGEPRRGRFLRRRG